MSDDAFRYLWAKTDPSTNQIHPLIYHLIDVGECTLALWNYALSNHSRNKFSQFLGLDILTTGKQLAFWAALHDLGKASPPFQRKYLPCLPELQSRGFNFPQGPQLYPAPHGILTAWALIDLLAQETSLDRRTAKEIAFTLGGHHGCWPTPDQIDPLRLKSSDKGDSYWDHNRKQLFLAIKDIYQPSLTVQLPQEDAERNTFLTLFSGLVSVADWVGSMAEFFPFYDEKIDLFTYSRRAASQARQALEQNGWLGWQSDGSLLPFLEMFPFNPNEIQSGVFSIAEDSTLPTLLILEAPTGIGKTEAALFLADTWLQKQRGRGIYIAMPTQATSNQMHERVENFLLQRYPNRNIHPFLVHGGALLEDDSLRPLQDVSHEEQLAGRIKAESWFLPRKRTLLAPFGVGTVDQALLSVLQTHHFFVRLFGLGQKVIIFDEIHAYDTYMSTLFQRLLRWLRSIDSSVILLSATLPDKTRLELTQAWSGKIETSIPPKAYPRVTLVNEQISASYTLPCPPSHDLYLEQVAPEPDRIAAHLAIKLDQGGCAAVICNRVRRAQEVYEEIRRQGIVEPENLILFHARFPYQWRKDIEDRVLGWMSKDGQRPQKAIVVATQVIEQSLDLDFDYMLSDYAPVDLLIQRAGRLHRHPKNNGNRPPRLKEPHLGLATPPVVNGLPDFGLDRWVYDRSILLRSWLALNEPKSLSLPKDVPGLIETVYGDNLDVSTLDPYIAQCLHRYEEEERIEREREVYQAAKRLIHLPDTEDFISQRYESLEEDDLNVHQAFRALTRLSEPGVSLICLHNTPAGIALEPDGTGAPINLARKPDREMVKNLLRRAVSVQRKEVLDYFIAHNPASSEWKKTTALRYHVPVVFTPDGRYRPEGAGFSLKLTRELGLQVIKETT